MQWNDGYSEIVTCFTNTIKNRDGGTHLTGFRQALTRTINNYANEYKLLKEAKGGLSGEDGCQRRRLPRAGSAPPEQAEAGTMPAQDGLRLDDGDRATPRRQQARADEKLQPVHEVELRTPAAAPKDVDLVAEDGVLDDQLPPGSNRVHGDACDLARRSVRGPPRPQPLYATKDPRPDSSDTGQTHPPLGARTG